MKPKMMTKKMAHFKIKSLMEYVNINCCPITGLSFDDPVAKKSKSHYVKTYSDKRTLMYEYKGENKSMADWSIFFGFDVYETVRYWKKKGKTIEQIFDSLMINKK